MKKKTNYCGFHVGYSGLQHTIYRRQPLDGLGFNVQLKCILFISAPSVSTAKKHTCTHK